MDHQRLAEILNIYKAKYEILGDVYLIFSSHSTKFEFFGRSQIDLIGDFEVAGKNRYRNIKPISIELVEDYDNIMFTLLHEITHCIIKYRERNVKNNWIIIDHGDDFYKNYPEVIEFAYQNKITDKIYSIDGIKKFDKNF